MFVNDQDTVKITLYYKQLPSGRLQVLPRLDQIGEKRLGFQAVSFEMRCLTWKQKNELMRQSRRMNALQQSELDWEAYQERLLTTLIAKWDAKEGDQPLAVTPENILRMHPQVAEVLLYEYQHSEN